MSTLKSTITLLTWLALSFSLVEADTKSAMTGKAPSTFRVCNISAVKYDYTSTPEDNPATHIVQLKQYTENNCTEILQMSKFPNNSFVTENGFVYTVVDAYRNHNNLVIRPDDVWAAIMTQFSFYINKHAEEFRKQFVSFDGKKVLSVTVMGNLRNAPYDEIVKLMSAEIHRNLVDPKIKNWILPNFTTTTDDDIVTMGVVFMATMKKYFEYHASLACGIPEITLEGSVEDWRNLYGRLEKLKEYKLGEWYGMLEPVVKQFVAASEGQVDLDFWQKMVHHVHQGSGTPYISGWITVFCAFDIDGKWRGSWKMTGSDWLRIPMDEIPSGIVEVDLKISDNGGKDYNSTLMAGHLGAHVVNRGDTLQPTLGWAIALKP